MTKFFPYIIVNLLLLITSITLEAQNFGKEANQWYFGNFLGIDFNSGTAVPVNGGQVNTTEGVAAISDANGNLLFYTDGITVWNKLHQIMPNGTLLFGDPSSTQSAVIVPKINDPGRYYIFTVDAVKFVFPPATFVDTRGLNYSIVNMALDNGKGDIEVKNVPLTKNSVEKITAVKHCNNRDVWVLAHDTASNGYYAYLVNPSGINTTPIISNTGSILPGLPRVAAPRIDSSFLGYMKVSPNGKKIAAAHWNVNVDLSDFDNATGIVSNTTSLFPPSAVYKLFYGVEFSPDCKLLYTSVRNNAGNALNNNELQQYNITLGSSAAIIASKQLIRQVFVPNPLGEIYGALQIGPDQKVYVTKRLTQHIAAINNPNVYGLGCNYVDTAISWSLPNQKCTYGFPSFIQSYFYPPDSFTYNISCNTAQFNYTPAAEVNSIKWDFGDPASGVNNTSTILNPTHTFSAAGLYTVKLIRFTNCGSDTLSKQINSGAIDIYLGNDTTVCGSTNLLLNGPAAGSTNTFLWQNGATTPTLTVTTAGLYWVQATSGTCTKRDSINVTFGTNPVYNLGADGPICSGDTLTLNATVTGATSYLWNNGAVTATIKAFQAGIYWCDVNKNGCTFRDSLTITAVNPAPVLNLGNDITVCQGVPVTLNATNTTATYLWQDGSGNATYTPTVTGLYWVEVTNTIAGCKKRDSINVTFTSAPVFNLGSDVQICAGQPAIFNATTANATSYTWSTGANSPTISTALAGLYWCEVARGTCTFRDTVVITGIKPSPTINLGTDQTHCEGTVVTLDASFPGATYTWNNGSTNPVFTVTTAGNYNVTLDLNGCKKSDTVTVNYNLKPRFTLGADQFICPGNTITLNPVIDPLWQLTWQDGTQNAAYTVTATGLYSLTATNNCGTATDDIVVSKGLCTINIPNAFTPNGDTKNDLFKVFGTDLVTSFNLKIFNRYGQVVFETADKNKGWDGKFNGKPSPGGGFVYFLNYKESSLPEIKTIKGTFILIR